MYKKRFSLVGDLYCASHLYGLIITGGPQLCLVVSEWHKINEDSPSPPVTATSVTLAHTCRGRKGKSETTVNHRVGLGCCAGRGSGKLRRSPAVLLTDGEKGPYRPRQHCRLSICDYWLSWTNTVSEAKIQITLLILRRGALSSL